MGPKHSQHEKKDKRKSSNNNVPKSAVLEDNGDPIIQRDFGLNREFNLYLRLSKWNELCNYSTISS